MIQQCLPPAVTLLPTSVSAFVPSISTATLAKPRSKRSLALHNTKSATRFEHLRPKLHLGLVGHVLLRLIKS